VLPAEGQEHEKIEGLRYVPPTEMVWDELDDGSRRSPLSGIHDRIFKRFISREYVEVHE